MNTINALKKYTAFPKRTVSAVLILATLAAVVYFFDKHHNLLTSLKHIPLYVTAEVFGLYILMLGVIIGTFQATMYLYDKKLKLKENSLINCYSLFMNFFIPGQTGVAFRAYYMKKNYHLKYLDYTLATTIYYSIYAVISIIFILAGSQPYYLTLPIVLTVIVLAVLGIKIYLRKNQKTRLKLTLKSFSYLAFITLTQVILQTIIYMIEIHSVKHGVRFSQVVTYAGTANLALFVALTPGAIGIRESFLILSEKLNHLSSSTIVLANVVDRSVYIAFLLILGVAIALLKVRDRLGVNKTIESTNP